MFRKIAEFFRSFFWGQDLNEYLHETKKVKVMGIRFTIRRLNIYDHLDGSKILTSYYQLYQSGKTKEAEASIKKVVQHYKDCFMAAVVEPKLKRKDDPNDPAIFVEEITNDLQLASALYTEIVRFTNDKKKVMI